MTNFDFLKQNKQFDLFADAAIAAEKIYPHSVVDCSIVCRRAMELAIKWMYSVDNGLSMPYQDNLLTLMSDDSFKDIVGTDIWRRLDYIRRIANSAAHSTKKISNEQVVLCLENLFVFMDFISYCYSDNYESRTFDTSLLLEKHDKPDDVIDVSLSDLIEENKQLKAALTAKRAEPKPEYISHPLELCEYKTRKLYIDTMLQDSGWIEGKDWFDEVELYGMPNQAGVGYADYVLYSDDGRALAIIEAKRTCVDVAKGRQQAKLYADILEKATHRRPVIFLSNGFETHIIDNVYPERKVASIWSKRDLEKFFNLQTMRTGLAHPDIDTNIAGRYYQVGAIKAVCESFDEKNKRKALLVMATGSGKTRTVIALCDVLLKAGWVKNILFLADRNALVTQAKRAFTNFLPNLSSTNLSVEKDNYNAHCVFSTYQTMYNVIDYVRDDEGKLFTCGHFDLVICDEAHRSVYNKYKDIFDYFDAPLVGLTATPKDEIDKNTYDIFELENGVPTYGYDLAQAVVDGHLVDFLSVETRLKFIEQGIVYEDLSEDEKEVYEATFENEDGELPESINSSALNEWIFNEDTIKQVLDVLMHHGLKINYGNTIGKTIIFAKNHAHAGKILEVFGKEYPSLVGYAKVIDNYMTYAQSAIDEFSDPNKLPQIAISVDMLDTGIDIPEILNLVFFKKVMSKAKFWQMIGRGTRLCPKLFNGIDKDKFYIFDFCGNFEFFRMNKGKASANMLALQGAIFNLKMQMVFKLQDIEYQTPELIEFRKTLVDDLVRKVRELNRNNFSVRQHLKYVELYSDPSNYQTLTYEDTLTARDELAPLILSEEDDATALRFDALMYGMEVAYLAKKSYGIARRDLIKKVQSLSSVANIPEIMMQSDLINRIMHTDYLERADVDDFENIRSNLRDLIKYIPKSHQIFVTNFTDEIISLEWKAPELEDDALNNYKTKAEFYINQHIDEEVISKLRNNIPMKESDIEKLQNILWKEVGTKEDYESSYGTKPVGELVREVVGMDMAAAKEAFAKYLNDSSLDSNQIYFINQIIEYIVHNGLLKDFSVLQERPFNDRGSVATVFTNPQLWYGIRQCIEQINSNAVAMAM